MIKMLSIIVPVYNVEKYLSQCLESIANQTSKNFEVIIVNDGSTDNCQSIIDKYCLNNKNFKCFFKENGGLMSAYLYGIEKSIGDYIGFVDSDDFIENSFVEKMYDENFEKADIVICERIDFFDDGNKTFNCLPPLIKAGFYSVNNNKNMVENIYENILPPFSGAHISNARWNKIFKRNIVLSNLKYCESKSRIMEDRFFTPSCMFSAKSFKFIENKLYYYRQRKTGSNHSKSSPHLFDTIKLLIKTQKKMLIDKNIFEKYRPQFEEASLNYLSLFIQRNILQSKKFALRKQYSRQIIRDKGYRILVMKYRKKLVGKMGTAIRLSFYLRSPFLLTLFSYFS